MQVVSQLSQRELYQRWRAEKDVSRARRIHAVFLAGEGRPCYEVAHLTGLSERRVQAWIKRYNTEGLEGLKDRDGRGRKPLLSPAEAEQLKARLDAGAQPEDGVCVLRAKDVQRILAREFGKVRRLGAVYRLLHQLGYASLLPRPQHPAADPAAQEAFKKTSRPSWPACKPNIPTAGWRSISRTRPAWASRER